VGRDDPARPTACSEGASWWGSGWRGHPANVRVGMFHSHQLAVTFRRYDWAQGSRASGRAIAEGSTHRELIRHGNTCRALHVGHVVHRVRARDCDRPDPAPSSPVSDTASIISVGTDRSPEGPVVGTRGKFPTFPGRPPRPQEVTRRVRGAIPRARTASGTSLGPPGRVVADRAPWPRSSSSRRWVPDVL
jgi:hypothetical protein